MKNKYLLILLALFLTSAVFAQTTVWNPAANAATTGLWTEADNWTNGLADGDFKVVFNVADAIECVLDDTIAIRQLVQGDGGYGSTIRVVQDGFLSTTAGWSSVAWTDTAVMVVETGGVVTFGEHLWLGWTATSFGTIILDGGTVNVMQMFGTAFEGGGGKGETYVNSGVLNLNGFDGAKSIPDGSLMDISNGTLMISGNQTAAVEAYVAAGKITAFGGAGEVVIEVVDGKTVVTGFDPLAPRDITDETPIKFVGSNANEPWPGAGSPAGEVLPYLFDNDVTTKYLVGDDSTWIDVITTVESVVTSYTITSANDAPDRDPRDWRLMGWNSMDEKWDTIHMVDDNPSWPDFFTPQTWTFTNDMAYTTYRLAIDSINYSPQNLMQIAEFEIFGVVGESIVLDVTDWGLVDLTSEFDDIPWGGAGTGSPGGEIPPYLVDNDTLTKVLTGNTDVWIDILTNHMSVVTAYTITSANDAPGRDPKDWTLQGWNADSASWDTLHVVMDNPSWDDLYTPKTWTFDNDVAYSKYRLDIDSVNGEPLMQISELELWGVLGDEVEVDITDLRDAEFKGQYEDLAWGGAGTGSPEGEALPFLFDNDVSTKFLVGTIDSYIDVLTPRSSNLTSYTITSANDAPERDPKDWMLLGLTSSLKWDTIHTVVDNPSWDDFMTPRTWEIENDGWYSSYRLHITANNGGDLMQIAELELVGWVGDTVTILRPDYPTPPTVVSIDPVNFATDVAVDASIVIEFSEAMAKAATEGALSTDPEIANASYNWDIFQTKLTISGDALAGETKYVVTVGTGAMDAEDEAMESEFTSQFTTVKVVGIEELSELSNGFYPNPATNRIYLMNQELADVEIYTAVGQLVVKLAQVSSVDVSDLQAGRYLVKITNTETSTVSSLIVE